MLKLFSAFDLFSSELLTTKTWGFPSIYFKGQVEVKCQCEEEGRIKSPIQYYFDIQCPVNTNKSVLLEFVGSVFAAKTQITWETANNLQMWNGKDRQQHRKIVFFSVRRATAAGIHRHAKRRQLLWEHERINKVLPLAVFMAENLPNMTSY